jgi:hypothetical protein
MNTILVAAITGLLLFVIGLLIGFLMGPRIGT